MDWNKFRVKNKGSGKSLQTLSQEYKALKTSRKSKSSSGGYSFSSPFSGKTKSSPGDYTFSKRFSGKTKSSSGGYSFSSPFSGYFGGLDLNKAPEDVVVEIAKNMDRPTLEKFCLSNKRVAAICKKRLGIGFRGVDISNAPEGVILETMKNMDYSTLKTFCSSNKRIAALCKSKLGRALMKEKWETIDKWDVGSNNISVSIPISKKFYIQLHSPYGHILIDDTLLEFIKTFMPSTVWKYAHVSPVYNRNMEITSGKFKLYSDNMEITSGKLNLYSDKIISFDPVTRIVNTRSGSIKLGRANNSKSEKEILRFVKK